jgi:hypothetical protein
MCGQTAIGNGPSSNRDSSEVGGGSIAAPARPQDVCHVCGECNIRLHRRCASCGAWLAPNACPECHHLNPPTAVSCAKCGSLLPEIAPTAPDEPVRLSGTLADVFIALVAGAALFPFATVLPLIVVAWLQGMDADDLMLCAWLYPVWGIFLTGAAVREIWRLMDRGRLSRSGALLGVIGFVDGAILSLIARGGFSVADTPHYFMAALVGGVITASLVTMLTRSGYWSDKLVFWWVLLGIAFLVGAVLAVLTGRLSLDGLDRLTTVSLDSLPSWVPRSCVLS